MLPHKVIHYHIILMFIASYSAAQTTIPFSSDQWTFSGEYKLEEFMGRSSVWINNSRAYLADVSFEDGIIEYDVAMSSTRGFGGVHFRMQNLEHYEEFYMRSHQSGNPDAMQYSPVYNGLAAWQLYYGEGYGAVKEYDFDQWMHVKLIISGSFMEVYIKDMQEPVLQVYQLKRSSKAGFLGLYTFLKGMHFANFTFQAIENPPLKYPEKSIPTMATGTVSSWEVSEGFPFAMLANNVQLPANLLDDLEWKTYKSEYSGTVNLAQSGGVNDSINTVFAGIEVEAKSETVKALHFGYSDEVKVYVNGQLLYSGNNAYRSRDYRYLGTIGYFDTLYVPLAKGKNRIIFAVKERLGGWGIKAQWVDTSGLSLAQ